MGTCDWALGSIDAEYVVDRTVDRQASRQEQKGWSPIPIGECSCGVTARAGGGFTAEQVLYALVGQ